MGTTSRGVQEVDITSIVEQAKERVLVDGNHMPTIHVEFDSGELALALFADLPETSYEKKLMFFGAGRKVGEAHKGKEARDICLVVESWVSFVPYGEERKYAMPADDPDKIEALTVFRLQAMPGPEKSEIVSSMQSFEMIRHGDSIDLLAREEIKQDVRNYSLNHFLIGIFSAEYTDQQLAEKIAEIGKSHD